MFRIPKQFHFSASHLLRKVPHDHPCGRLHGHNYIVEVELALAEFEVRASAQQWVRDFGDLSVIRDWIDETWDHHDLNVWVTENKIGGDGWRMEASDQWRPMETTAEMLAWYIWARFVGEIPELAAVRVSETPKSWAEYRSP